MKHENIIPLNFHKETLYVKQIQVQTSPLQQVSKSEDSSRRKSRVFFLFFRELSKFSKWQVSRFYRGDSTTGPQVRLGSAAWKAVDLSQRGRARQGVGESWAVGMMCRFLRFWLKEWKREKNMCFSSLFLGKYQKSLEMWKKHYRDDQNCQNQIWLANLWPLRVARHILLVISILLIPGSFRCVGHCLGASGTFQRGLWSQQLLLGQKLPSVMLMKSSVKGETSGTTHLLTIYESFKYYRFGLAQVLSIWVLLLLPPTSQEMDDVYSAEVLG